METTLGKSLREIYVRIIHSKKERTELYKNQILYIWSEFAHIISKTLEIRGGYENCWSKQKVINMNHIILKSRNYFANSIIFKNRRILFEGVFL